MNTGYLFAIGTLITWTISTFVLAKLSRLEKPATINKAALFFSTLLLGSIVCIVDGIAPLKLFTRPTIYNWTWLGVSGILGKSIGDYYGYSALRILGVRRRSMITTLGPGFTWLFGLIILYETINLLGIVAMFLTIIFLVLLINSNTEKQEVIKENYGLPIPGFLFGIGAAALTGLAFILSKKAFVEPGTKISEFHAVWIRIIVAFIALFLFDLVRNKNTPFIQPFLNKQKGSLLFVGILFGAVLGLSFSLMAIVRVNAAVAYSIFSLLPVSIMLVSTIVYRKRVTLKSWAYSLLAVAGVMILIWREYF